MKIFLFIFILICIISQRAFSQLTDSSLFYRGYVFHNGQPLQAASVVSAATKKGVQTNRAGFFKISKVPGTKMMIHFTAIG